MKKMQQGFTLIELMIVVAIIGILAAIAIPAYSDYVTRSKWADTLSSVASIKTAVGECADNNNTDYTVCDTQADLAEYGVGVSDVGAGALTKYNASITLETDTAAIVLTPQDDELGGSTCTVSLTPTDSGAFTTWTPVTDASCIKFVKGASTATP